MNTEKAVETQNYKEKATVFAEFFNTAFTWEPDGEVPSIQEKDVGMFPVYL